MKGPREEAEGKELRAEDCFCEEKPFIPGLNGSLDPGGFRL